MERVRMGVKKLLRRGIDRGEFPAVLDEELGTALLLGPMMFRHIFGSSIDQEWLARGAVESYWKANARQKEAGRRDPSISKGERRSNEVRK